MSHDLLVQMAYSVSYGVHVKAKLFPHWACTIICYTETLISIYLLTSSLNLNPIQFGGVSLQIPQPTHPQTYYSQVLCFVYQW